MKLIWQLTYETIPGNGEQTKKYKSFSEAKKDIRKLISQIDLSPYTKAIRAGASHKSCRSAIADFLDKYVSRPDFFSADEVIPSADPDDYEFEKNPKAGDDAGEEIHRFNDFEISIGGDSVSFTYQEDQAGFWTDMVVMDDDQYEYSFQFYVDRAPKNKLKELQMTLTRVQYWGTSSYPLLILRTLENSQEPLDQQQIISRIEASYETTIERKAIGRNIALLKDIGYDIQHNSTGYFIPKKAHALEQEDFQAIVKSVKANTELDDNRKQKLKDNLYKM